MALTLNTGSSQYTNLLAAWPGPGYETDLKGGVTLTGNGDGETTEAQTGAPEGTAWKCAAAGAGYSVTTPAGLKATGVVTLVGWLNFLGDPTGQTLLFGVEYDNAQGSPYSSYAVGTQNNSRSLVQYTNNGSGLIYANAGSAIASGTPTLLIAEFNATTIDAWANGTSYMTGSTSGTRVYAASSITCIGEASDRTGTPNARIWDVRIYDGALDSTARAAILSNPNDLYTGGGGGGSTRRTHAGIIY